MKTTTGDLIKKGKNGEFDLIIHGCNCFCTMGAGIAKGIKREFPEAYEADKRTTKGDKSKLGSCSYASVLLDTGELIVVNAYTQYDYRGKGVKVDYVAVRSCLKWVKRQFTGRRIGLPKIGAGLAGGDWQKIFRIVEEELDGEDVTLVEYRP